MKKLIFACAAAALIFGAASCDGNAGSNGGSFNDSISTAFGRLQGSQTAQSFKQIPEADRSKFNKDAFLRGYKEALMTDTADYGYVQGLMSGAQAWFNFQTWRQQDVADANISRYFAAFSEYFNRDSLSMEELATIQGEMQTLFNQVTARLQAKQDSIRAARQAERYGSPEATKAKGQAYLDSIMKADPEVKVTESGLGYKVVKQGKGNKFTATDTAPVIYTGRLIDGKQFDSSNGRAVDFPVSGVVPGFSEGLQMMNPGSKYILYIPSSLGYGDRGNDAVPGGSMMVFDVEIPE